ncbi:MAG: hypothetical protein BHV69_09555 [Bacteroidales bacterium 52_46]|nr:MAG: hypothetical protein BHV69_09555 [Bacteroidales bacterium 52_46]
MRLEVAGAQITDAVVDVLDTLQNQPDIAKTYTRTIDEVTRLVILDLSTVDEQADTEVMNRLRALQMLRRDIVTLSSPPDVDIPANDVPAASL